MNTRPLSLRLLPYLLFLGSLFTLGSLKAQQQLYPNTFPLKAVTITDGPMKHAIECNIQTLLAYDVDRLLAPYRKEAGLPEKAKGFPNWDGLDGHVGGHYLSAMAIHYAATGNQACKERMDYMLAELKACQEANGLKYPDWGVGYVGGVPNGVALWPVIKAGDISVIWKYWVPWYNVHKMYAGLRDAWLYTGNADAKDMFLKFCNWAMNLTGRLSADQMEQMLGNEYGGMNEIFADAYQMTSHHPYLETARRFSHRQILDAMAKGEDNLDNKHANTQVPKAVGFQRIAEVGGETHYANAARFFWETVTDHRSVAFGGNSRREHFPSKAACTDFITEVEGPETCNSYNMLKLTEDLFRVDPQARYADYYERTLYNHILSTQHPEHGGYVYFTPLRPRHYRVYSAPNQGMWCCVGSGMENHGKYGQFIYTHAGNALYVNLFVPSTLDWQEKGLSFKQETAFPYEESTTLTLTKGKGRFSIRIRVPHWVEANGLHVLVNGKATNAPILESGYLNLERNWKKGDKISLTLPMKTYVETMPNVSNYIAILHGPILLGAKTGKEAMSGLIANDSRWAHIAHGQRLPVDQAPILIEDNVKDLGRKLLPIAGKPLHFSMANLKLINGDNLELEPFYGIHDSRYAIYWMTLTSDGYQRHLDSVALAEKAALELQKRTLDRVIPGEQQPEADHFIQSERSRTGNFMDYFWRDAQSGGFFSYQFSTKGAEDLSLMVRYWGAEQGRRAFTITVDDVELVSENIANRWNSERFIDVTYPIPATMLKGKTHIRVAFKAVQGNTAGSVYDVRLVTGQATTTNQPQTNNGNMPTFSNFVYTGNDKVFAENPLKPGEFYNPILQGCYPDPSITRRGDDYFLVCSSFAMFPGVPIFHSKDLVNWTSIGHVLDRPSQLKVENCGISAGIYAPQIIYNPTNKTFYMITTQISGGIGNMVVKTKDPFKGWSDPIKLAFNGIDPSLFFDDNGKAYIVHNDAPDQGKALYEGHRVIKIWEYDVVNDKIIPGTDKIIVDGGVDLAKKPIWIEAPHIYKKNGMYYLMCAEGGTGDWHSEVIFISKSPKGPYTPAPSNPILTQRHFPKDRANKVDWAGHADLVLGPDNKTYYGVFLAVRPNEQHRVNTGRETFILPVDWSGTFPVFVNGLVPMEPKLKMPTGVTANKTGKDGFFPAGNFTFTDNFTADKLDQRWIGLRGPREAFATTTKNGLQIKPFPTNIKEVKPTSTLFHRQMHQTFSYEVTMQYQPSSEKDLAGLVALQSERFNYVFGITRKGNDTYLLLERNEGKPRSRETSSTILASTKLALNTPVRLKIAAEGDQYTFSYAQEGSDFKRLGDVVSGDILSTDVAGGFTGCLLGLYATSANTAVPK